MATNLLVFQMLHYAQQKHTYHKLLERAENIFPSSQIYDNFKSELKLAFNSQQTLDDYEFALDTFESLRTYQTSPLQANQELANITKDPRFSTFTEIAAMIDMPYSATMFVPTVEMAEKINEETLYKPEISMFAETESQIDTEKAKDEIQKTDKVVLKVNDYGIQNPEALFSSDGMVSKDNITTQKIEDEKEQAFENAISNAQNAEDVTQAIEIANAFNKKSLGSPNGDIYYDSNIDSVYQQNLPSQVNNFFLI